MKKPPTHLSPDSKRLCTDLLEQFDPGEDEYELLVAALGRA